MEGGTERERRGREKQDGGTGGRGGVRPREPKGNQRNTGSRSNQNAEGGEMCELSPFLGTASTSSLAAVTSPASLTSSPSPLPVIASLAGSCTARPLAGQAADLSNGVAALALRPPTATGIKPSADATSMAHTKTTLSDSIVLDLLASSQRKRRDSLFPSLSVPLGKREAKEGSTMRRFAALTAVVALCLCCIAMMMRTDVRPAGLEQDRLDVAAEKLAKTLKRGRRGQAPLKRPAAFEAPDLVHQGYPLDGDGGSYQAEDHAIVHGRAASPRYSGEADVLNQEAEKAFGRYQGELHSPRGIQWNKMGRFEPPAVQGSDVLNSKAAAMRQTMDVINPFPCPLEKITSSPRIGVLTPIDPCIHPAFVPVLQVRHCDVYRLQDV